MKDLLNLLVVLLIVLALTVASAAHCAEKLTCENVLSLCDKALSAEKEDNKRLQDIVGLQDQYIKGLNKELKEGETLLPGWAWVAIGIAVGVTTIQVLK